MNTFIFPDYGNNNILNLTNSIINTVTKEKRPNELSILNSNELRSYDNIILIVIDGLGYNYLKKHAELFINRHIKFRLTSSFLSTTVCANTVFHTGQTPNQTGITGWFTYLRNIGMIVSISNFKPMINGDCLTNAGLKLKQFINVKPFYEFSLYNCYIITNKKNSINELNKLLYKGAKIITEDETNKAIDDIISISKIKSKNLIHLYLNQYDNTSHKNGPNSTESLFILQTYDKEIQRLAENLKGTNSIIIVTSDHGFLDTSQKDILYLKDFPRLKNCLVLPFTSEPRCVGCFVKPDKIKEFESVINEELKEYCVMIKNKEIIRKQLYGQGINHHEFNYRIGDYMLLMKNKYVFKYHKSKTKAEFKGNHGGLHPDEMYVPLIIIKTNI